MKESQCRSCKADIYFIEMESGRLMPVDQQPVRVVIMIDEEPLKIKQVGKVVSAYRSHFETCPQRDDWRKD